MHAPPPSRAGEESSKGGVVIDGRDEQESVEVELRLQTNLNTVTVHGTEKRVDCEFRLRSHLELGLAGHEQVLVEPSQRPSLSCGGPARHCDLRFQEIPKRFQEIWDDAPGCERTRRPL